MTTVERTGLIAAPLDAVWEVLADFAAISSWAPNVDHSCLMSEQTEDVGTVRRIQTGRTTLVETVDHLGAGRRRSHTRSPGCHRSIRSVTNTWRIGASATPRLVVLTTEIDAGPRPPQQVIAKLVGRRLAAASEQMLAGLTEHLERGGNP